MKQLEEGAMPNILPVISPTEPSFLGPTCALWDCSRLLECGKDYCCSFHAASALEDGQPGKAPIFRPRGISLKDSALFDALIAWNQGKAVGIPNCEGAATLKSPWNDSSKTYSFFDLVLQLSFTSMLMRCSLLSTCFYFLLCIFFPIA